MGVGVGGTGGGVGGVDEGGVGRGGAGEVAVDAGVAVGLVLEAELLELLGPEAEEDQLENEDEEERGEADTERVRVISPLVRDATAVRDGVGLGQLLVGRRLVKDRG